MQITLIQDPPYTIDLRGDEEAAVVSHKENNVSKVQKVVQRSFQVIGFIFSSFKEASWITLKYSWTSFKYVVLGYYGSLRHFTPPEDIYLAVFKVFIWVLGMSWCITATTCRLFKEKLTSDQTSYLNFFASEEIDLKHIKTREVALDVSGVPLEVKVDDLAEIFNNVNFTDRTKPGYVGSSTCREGNTTYSPEELKTSLNTFINNIKKRVPFLGTPPSYDIPRLMAFYQQMEDALRLSLHKMNQKFAEFKACNGEDPESYNEATRQLYENLLEDQNRMVIELAIAGKHCGARYMGDVMTIYYYMYGDSLQSDKSLEENLIELLAQKRKEIALSQIETHFGNNTHAFGKYMANLGKILAIPGTQNVIEHLDTSFNVDTYLKHFFQEYTVDVIITAIQDQVKKSQVFREKITDWLSAQVKDWTNREPIDIQAIAEDVNMIIRENNHPDCRQVENLKRFLELIQFVKEQYIFFDPKEILASNVNQEECLAELLHLPEVVEFLREKEMVNLNPGELTGLILAGDYLITELLAIDQVKNFLRGKRILLQSEEGAEKEVLLLNREQMESNDGWDEFIADIFAMDRIENFLRDKHPSLDLFQMKIDCSSSAISGDLSTELKLVIKSDGLANGEKLMEYFSAINKVSQIRKILNEIGIYSIDGSSLYRALNGETKFDELIKDHLDLERGNEFIACLQLDNIASEGISKEIMEWLLVSNNILLPQSIEQESAK